MGTQSHAQARLLVKWGVLGIHQAKSFNDLATQLISQGVSVRLHLVQCLSHCRANTGLFITQQEMIDTVILEVLR